MKMNTPQIEQTPESSSSDHLVDLEGLATRLMVSKRSVWRLVASGDLVPPIKVGRMARWFEGDIETYLDRKRQQRDSNAKALSWPRGES